MFSILLKTFDKRGGIQNKKGSVCGAKSGSPEKSAIRIAHDRTDGSNSKAGIVIFRKSQSPPFMVKI